MSPTDGLTFASIPGAAPREISGNAPRGDVGGFGVGSNLSWQVFLYVSWRVSKLVSLQGGCRVLSVDYEKGSGTDRIKYGVVQLGPQLGITFSLDL